LPIKSIFRGDLADIKSLKRKTKIKNENGLKQSKQAITLKKTEREGLRW